MPLKISQFCSMANIDVNRVQFRYIDTSFYFPNRTRLKFFLMERLHREGFKAEAINYIFCTDEYLLILNQEYLKHDTYTDIITFALSPKGQPLISDIYISIDRVRENAKSFNKAFIHELHRVVFHGVLHLSGYKDKTKSDALRMREMEEKYLGLYFRST